MNDKYDFENFRKALAKLEEFTSDPVSSERDRAGVIQGFEFTFEQCWKTFQKIAHQEGLEANSPRQSLKVALQLGIIEANDEENWLQMMQDRNLTSHLYQENLAELICQRIINSHLSLLQGALKRISGEMMESDSD